ncbi:hypothetical protein [Gimesia algae]|uniref:Uncharacterized protein n=1 Tax=Gimesia algae TaxID=2527971 RepID=A0A517VMS4_9PLAN|nr:hypothetical protein [Gimesia algae]QDT94285.1 hypothetical protein Pan161_59800 [Gimesia algae]
MGLEYKHLDERTRRLMLEEIEHDVASSALYLSTNLNENGIAEYPDLIREAARSGDDDTLAAAIVSRLNSHEKPRQLKSGKLSKPPVMRSNAHQMLAEGEFNRFYMRALCSRAIGDGVPSVIVFRAKTVEHARSASEQMIGRAMSADSLLEDLRNSTGVDTALGLPPGPNSGLSVHLP